MHYMAFFTKTEPDRISVDRVRYRTIEQSLAGKVGWRLARLRTGAVRALRFSPPLPAAPLTVDSAPIEGNAAHAEIAVCGTVSKNGIKEKICGELARISTLVP